MATWVACKPWELVGFLVGYLLPLALSHSSPLSSSLSQFLTRTQLGTRSDGPLLTPFSLFYPPSSFLSRQSALALASAHVAAASR